VPDCRWTKLAQKQRLMGLSCLPLALPGCQIGIFSVKSSTKTTSKGAFQWVITKERQHLRTKFMEFTGTLFWCETNANGGASPTQPLPRMNNKKLFFCRRAKILEELRIDRQNDGCTFAKGLAVSFQSPDK